jgi:EpsI family protein
MISNRRFGCMLLILVTASLGYHALPHGTSVVLPAHLASLPLEVGQWHGTDVELESPVVKAIGADDYLNRLYTGPHGNEIGLYVGYFGMQRTDESIHSPRNCLPGTGWEPVGSSYISLQLADGHEVRINQYLVQKGFDRQVVLYWYQSHGRVIASEYTAKLYMVKDAITMHRTDSALIRVNTPLTDSGKDRAAAFVADIWAQLDQRIPK